MRKKRILILSAVLVLALAVGCAVYVGDYYRASENAAAAMAGTPAVAVRQTDEGTVFLPESPTAGFIFYPGGKVEYTAYAPLMLELAQRDVLCVLVRMPLNLAVLDVNAAAGIREQFPEIGDWYIGGHSLGGSMAASFASKHADGFQGLALLAAYSTADLTQTGLKVISLYGSEDGVLNREKYESYRVNLPENTAETVIEGGNHAGFGSYGAQDGDGNGQISAQEQTRVTAELLTEFFAG